MSWFFIFPFKYNLLALNKKPVLYDGENAFLKLVIEIFFSSDQHLTNSLRINEIVFAQLYSENIRLVFG